MAEINKPLDQRIVEMKIGRFDLVKIALDWIAVKKYDEDYRKLTQADLLSKALEDVVSGVATYEKIAELQKKQKPAKEAVKEENV